jgi:hypothetical protein
MLNLSPAEQPAIKNRSKSKKKTKTCIESNIKEGVKGSSGYEVLKNGTSLKA